MTHRLSAAVGWIGGGLFAGSLAYFAHFFLVRLGRPALPSRVPRRTALLRNTLRFTIFALHHSVLARSGAKRHLVRMVPSELERSVYVWAASLLFLGVCARWERTPGTLYRMRGVWRVAGGTAQTAGLLLIARSTASLDPLELAGIRQARHDATEAPPLSDAGPYRFVRHPLYLGWILLVFGAPAMTMDRALFAVLSSAYLVAAIPLEERSLRAQFGEAYDAYRARVRWRLVPGVY